MDRHAPLCGRARHTRKERDESGHDYAAPEPGRGLLLAFAAAALGLRRRRCRQAAACAFVCLVPALAAAAELRATSFQSSLAGNVSSMGSSSLTPGPGSLQITAGTTASDSIENPFPPPAAWDMEALGTAIGIARYGSLAGNAHAEASSLPGDAGSPLARVQIYVRPGFTDAALVVSDSLAAGSPVTLTFRMALDATAIHVVDPANGVGPTAAGATFEVEIRDLNVAQPPVTRFLSVASDGTNITSGMLELGTAIGHRIELLADLSVGAQVWANFAEYEVAQGSADAVAGNTGELLYEPAGDVRLVTDSGHDYAAPEPGRGLLLALAAAALLLRRGLHPRGARAAAG